MAPERLLVIGGDAAGMAAASQARRRRPPADLEIVALEKGRWTSYSACGIPYVVGGDVDDLDELIVRSPETFRADYSIDARTEHEVIGIDLDRRRAEVRDHSAGRTYAIGFDTLHIATGAVPTRPALPGIDGPDVHGVQTLEDAAHLLDHAHAIARSGPSRVVVVGGGYIGLEMAEAFIRRGAIVTVVTSTAQPLSILDPDMGALVAAAMRDHDIDVRCNQRAVAFEPGAVHLEGGTMIPADLVILGIGVHPNSGLAVDAGIETGDRGAIVVDQRQRTSAEGVWAAGDCCESFHRVTRRYQHVALGTVANKQGRVAGINIGGSYATFPGVVGTAVSKLCALEVGRTGVTEAEAQEAGFEYAIATITSTTRAGYFPGAGEMKVKMLAERGSGRVLGAQIVGREGAAKRIDIVATALTARMTVEEMTALDLSYAPPFSPVWDPVLIAARKVAERL